jgi:hypothetical protein
MVSASNGNEMVWCRRAARERQASAREERGRRQAAEEAPRQPAAVVEHNSGNDLFAIWNHSIS